MDPGPEQFERMKDTPTYWYNHASDLRASAAALDFSRRQEISDQIVAEAGMGRGFSMAAAVGGVYGMLWGMSFELLFKGIAVAMGQKFKHTHDLEDLATSIGFSLSTEDTEALKYLTGCIVWEGRYPVPKNFEQFQAHDDVAFRFLMKPVSHNGFIKTYSGRKDWKELNVLWSRAEKMYYDKAGH